MELKKLKKIKIGKNYFYKDNIKKIFYSKQNKINPETLQLILTKYKKFRFEFF